MSESDEWCVKNKKAVQQNITTPLLLRETLYCIKIIFRVSTVEPAFN